MQRETPIPGWLRSLETADGMFAVDSSRNIVLWNDAAEVLLGHTAGVAIGKKCYDLLGTGLSPAAAFCRPECIAMANAGRGCPTPTVNIDHRTPGGEIRRLSLSTVVAADHGEVRLLHLFRDAGAAAAAPRWMPAQADAGATSPPSARTEDPPAPRPALSKREAQTLALLARGLDTAQIAGELGVKRVTARNHVGRLLDRLGVRTRLQAVVAGYRLGLIES
jgi:DNA-binding CsgD family transcriptional regulator